MKAMIFAAGMGTRLKPFTEHHPKALAKVAGKPMLQHTLEYLHRFGIEEFIINIHHFGEQIIDFLSANNNFGLRITISDERADLLETGGGLLKAQRHILEGYRDDFLVMNADILTRLDLAPMIAQHKNSSSAVTLAVSDRPSSRKLLLDGEGIMRGWKNEKTGETLLATGAEENHLRAFAFSGIHCLSPDVFRMIRRDGKFSIMEEYKDMMHDGLVRGYIHTENVIDIGTPESLARAEAAYNEQ